jgi:hypothetical protein
MERKLHMYGLMLSGILVGSLVSTHARAQASNEQAANSIETVASLDLALNEPVTPADYTLAMHMLSMAMDMNPTDADLARSVVEAAWSAGDQEELIRATRVVIKNDPKDTVAQLRLISAIVNRAQTAEGRIEAYKRFVGGDDSPIDASVRSRLMLDMALLERERGNETAFLSALRGAAKLDPANKEAQSLVVQHYSQVINDQSTIMSLQMRVLYADPLDPHVHIAIARMCAAEGATDAAWRFLNTGIAIFRIDSGQVPPRLQEQQLSLLWQYEGAQAILDRLDPTLADERATRQAQIDARIAADEPYDDLEPPTEIRYEPGTDRIRLLAAFILKNQETVDSVLMDLQRSLIAYYVEVRDQMAQRGANKGALLGSYLNEVVTFQTMRAIVGVDAELIRNDMNSIVAEAPELEKFFRPFEPFSLFAGGEYLEAKNSAIEQLAASAPRDLLIALASERLGQTAEAIELYTQLTLDYPLEATGALARSRLEELTNGEDQTTPEGMKMREIANQVPAWFDQMIVNPENTMSLSIAPTKSSFESGEQSSLTIRLVNISTLPLSLGSAHPIDSNLLIVPGFREIDTNFKGKGRSKVIDLGRRLRLNPLEELVVEVEPDSIQTRWLIQSQPQSAVRQRWRALQGFKPLPGGGIVNSPFALVSETPLIERRVLAEATASIDVLVEGLGSTNPDEVVRCVRGAGAILYKPDTRPDFVEDDFKRLVNALWDCYASSDTANKVWMLGVLPTKVASPAMASFDERVQQTLTADSLVDSDLPSALVAMTLLTRVESMSSPMFDVAKSHSDGRVQWIAEQIEKRIMNIEPMYAGTDRPFEAFGKGPTQTTGF